MAYHTKTISERIRELLETAPIKTPSFQEFVDRWCMPNHEQAENRMIRCTCRRSGWETCKVHSPKVGE